VTYLFDNNLSFRFAYMLQALGVDVVAVRDVPTLGESSKDPEILAWLEGRECIFLTGDQRIRTRPLEVAALRQHHFTALFKDRFWAKLTFWPQAAWLVAHWPQIEQFSMDALPGACAVLQQRGRIRLL
jgi:PIN domain-containing protein